MPFRPSPGPWKLVDNEGRSYKVVAQDGTVICYIHYPQSVEQAANCKLVERCFELLEKFRNQKTIMEAVIRQAGQDPKRDAFVQAAEAFIAELEIRDPVKKPPGEGGSWGK
jgi:hypothetical protein